MLDAKDSFTKQRLFEAAWKELYPGMIEWVALSQGGAVTSVDACDQDLVTDFGKYTATVANVIPPQKAGRIAEIAGAADRTGWCPIDPVDVRIETACQNIHVIGDACHRRRDAEIGVRRQCAGTSLRGRDRRDAVGQDAEPPRADRRLLQHCRAGLRASRCRASTAQGRPVRRGRGGATSARSTRRARCGSARPRLRETWFRTITAEIFG